jgi:hypothetical protein
MSFKICRIPVLFCLLLSLTTSSVVWAQNVLDDIEEEERVDNANAEGAPPLVSEKIKIIAPSKKIFILTNENKTFSKGDFISLLLANKLVCRALVAKTTDDQLSGIKIVKIYNLDLWKQLTPEKEVLVLKGDDSYYVNLGKVSASEVKIESKLQDEEDLYNSTSLEEDDLSLEENSKRLIKTDNLLSVGVGMISGKDVDGSTKTYSHFNGAWAYQLTDNIWGELGLGTHTITDFPSTGVDTRVINYMVKVKYTFNAPFYSYIMPYVGYQVLSASAPDADSTISAEQIAAEETLLDQTRKSSVIFGVGVLKRIVPGWFIRADVGTDFINGGLTLEF